MNLEEFLGNATVSAVVGGSVSSVVTLIMQSRVSREQSENKIVELLIGIKSEARQYWLRTGQNNGLEISLENGIVKARENLLRHAKKFSYQQNELAIKQLTTELHAVLTGGGFSSPTRQADNQRFQAGERIIQRLIDAF